MCVCVDWVDGGIVLYVFGEFGNEVFIGGENGGVVVILDVIFGDFGDIVCGESVVVVFFEIGMWNWFVGYVWEWVDECLFGFDEMYGNVVGLGSVEWEELVVWEI